MADLRSYASQVSRFVENMSPLRRKILSVALVVAVVGLHIFLRWRVNDKRNPLEFAGLYPHCYSRSLSLMIGHGYQRLPLADDAASRPIREFLDLKQASLPERDLQAYVASLPTQQQPDLGNYRQVDLMRSGDLYTAALVWKVFGISWVVLNRFYILVSAAACLAIFLATRKISNSFTAGLTAALLFALCRYESSQVIRDTSPIWFVAFAALALTNLSGRRSTFGCAVGGCLLGLFAVLGYGWRPQLLFFAPLFLALGLLRRGLDGATWRQLALTTATFVAAAGVMYGVFRRANDSPDEALMTSGFHVAYFGEQKRAALGGAEVDFQIDYDDSKVAADVQAYCVAAGLKAPLVYDAVYADTCRTFYLETMRHHLYYWVRNLPQTLYAAVSGVAADARPNVWQRLVPVLFLIGLLAIGNARVDQVALVFLLVLMGFYLGIWFGISPETRHWGVFLVPVSIIAGLAPSVVATLLQEYRSGVWRVHAKNPRVWSAPALLIILLVVWGGGCLITHNISSAARADYWQEIASRREKSVDASTHIDSQQSFAVNFPEGDAAVRRGYWLEVEGGSQPQELVCKRIRLTSHPLEAFADWDGNPPGGNMLDRVREVLWWNTFSETRHRVLPGKKQVFFVTCQRETSGGDTRSYSLKVSTAGDAKITAARELNLSDWRRLPVSSMFQTDDPSTTPHVGGVTAQTLAQFTPDYKTLAQLGFAELAPVAQTSGSAQAR